MMGFGKRNDRRFPELLAAYADGELDAKTRARVEAWLAAHPAADSALEAQRRLSPRNRRFWRAAAAPNPCEAAWDKVFGQVQETLDAPLLPMRSTAQPRRRWSRILLPAMATAAAVALTLGLLHTGADAPRTAGTPSAVENAFVVATAADIDVISLDERDVNALVIGQPPLAGPIVLASAGDVGLKRVEKAEDGMMPKVQMNEAGLSPMIIAPLAGR